MTDLQLGQLSAALVATVTPWIVVRIACRVAAWHARSVEQPFLTPPAAAHVGMATAVALPVVAALGWRLSFAPPWMAVLDGLVFVVLSVIALRALHQIGEASRPACELPSSRRAADLAPRRMSDYLAWPWRILPVGTVVAGLALMAWRLADPVAHRRLVVPLTLAFAAFVFVWLYETWIYQLVSGGTVPDGNSAARRQRLVRLVFGAELILVAVCVPVAHVLLDVDWVARPAYAIGLSLAAALVGVSGCALALSSDLARRRYADRPRVRA